VSKPRVIIGLIASVLLLAALASYTAFAVHHVEQTFPPAGSFVEARGERVHYIDVGSGPSVVLLHGASANLRDFLRSLVPELVKHHRVLAFDRPGFGYSTRPAGPWPSPDEQARVLGEAMERLGVERPVLIGHSWSGSVVLARLLQDPDVAGAVLIAGASHPWDTGVAWHNHLASVPVIGPLFAWTMLVPIGQLAIQSAIQDVFAPEQVPAGYQSATGAALALRPPSYLANAQDLRELSPWLEAQSLRYGEITQPLLLISGDVDDVVPPRNHAERLVRQVSDAELVYLEGAGHAPHHSRTHEVTERVLRFIGMLDVQR